MLMEIDFSPQSFRPLFAQTSFCNLPAISSNSKKSKSSTKRVLIFFLRPEDEIGFEKFFLNLLISFSQEILWKRLFLESS